MTPEHVHRWVRDGSMPVGNRRVQRKRCTICGARAITGEMPAPLYMLRTPAQVGFIGRVEASGPWRTR